MKLSDCEISHRVMRGHIVVTLFGAHALAADELAALRAEYEAVHGPGVVPCYVSPDGWQALDDVPGPLASRFVFDEAEGVVLVNGLSVAAEFVQQWTAVTPDGQWFRVISTDNGRISVERREFAAAPAAAAPAEADAAPAAPAELAKAPPAPAKKRAA